MPSDILLQDGTKPPQISIDQSVLPSDEKRAQELDQYFRPLSPVHIYPDPVLTAHMQLIAWRLDIQRAMVSFIDRDTQFFVAESTKIMDLRDSSMFDGENHELCAGGTSVPLAGRLCELTIVAEETADGSPAHFESCDLTADERVRHVAFVTDHPHFRYYCGMPLRSKTGTAIGTIFVLDSRTKEPMSASHLNFLSDIAKNVMTHVETRKEKMDVKRVMKMNKSLAEFVDPTRYHWASATSDSDSSCQPSDAQAKDKRSSSSRSSNYDEESDRPNCPDSPTLEEIKEHDQDAIEAKNVENTEHRRLSGDSNQTKSSFSSRLSSDTPVPEEDHDYNSIFSRAADLIKASLSLERGGGVLFLDTVAAPTAYEGDGKCAEPTVHLENLSPYRDALDPPVSRTASNSSQREGVSRHGHCAVLASSYHSTSEGDVRETHVPDQQNHSSVPARCLMKFVKRFPEGRMWYYPELHSSSDSEPDNLTEPKRSSEELELKKLFSHLPGALQLLFIPFWNMHLSRWAVCLAYTLSRHRVFTYEVDYYFSRAFCNCVKAEIDRLAVVFADKHKGDFIGSVSHELRSPLHGILASCEFLDETETTTFQRSLIDTTESCAHTLLDTIDMVLDYSKINAFAKTKDSTPNPVNAQAQVVKGGTEPLLNIHSTVNIAAIAEEVIEGIATGHLAKSESNMRFNDAGSSSGRGSRRDQGSSNTTETCSAKSTRSPVEIIFEIVSPPDWFFVTQPGAFRRVLMNIFGNALKYTEHGFIKISLDRSDADGSPPCSPGSAPDANVSLVTFTVTDSGKGITQSFMQTKMFTAFAQENPMAPGTGLGLSLVRSIVNMLNGDIKIESQVDVGTVVTVTIPMKKAAPPLVLIDEGMRHPALETLRQLHPNTKPQVAVYEQSLLGETERQTKVSHMQRQALSGYIREWYDLDPLEDWNVDTRADILCIDEVHLPAVIEILNKLDSPKPSLIVFCENASRITMITRSVTYPRLEVMAKPFGPYKLAKVLRLALDNNLRKGSVPEETAGSASPKTLVGTEGPKVAYTRMYQDSRRHSGISNMVQGGLRRSIVAPSPLAISGLDEDFPFPSMTFVPASGSITLRSASPPKTEPSGLMHRRMKSHEVSSANPTVEDSTAITRSRSDSDLHVARTYRQPTLLLVDDNEVNLRLLHMFVTRRCYKSVTLARDGAQAVDAYKEAMNGDQPIDFIFMDISMPIMDGFEATRNIRLLESSSAGQRADRSVPAHQALIVAITGNASAKDQEDAFTHGLDFYMTKPVSLKETGKLLQRWEEKCKEHGAEGAREAMLTTTTASSA